MAQVSLRGRRSVLSATSRMPFSLDKGFPKWSARVSQIGMPREFVRCEDKSKTLGSLVFSKKSNELRPRSRSGIRDSREFLIGTLHARKVMPLSLEDRSVKHITVPGPFQTLGSLTWAETRKHG